MSHSAASLARYIVDRQATQEKTLTPMQLMKIVFICHGMHLGLHGEPLIDEPVEAWAYGPVIRDLYSRIKQYGSGPVKTISAAPANLSSEEEELVNAASDFYGDYNGISLSKLTHMPGTPWAKTMSQSGKNSIIPDDLMAEYYAPKNPLAAAQ